MYERILIPLDGSEAAEEVFPYVEEITARMGSEVLLTSVSEYRASETSYLYRAYLEKAQEVFLRGLKKYQVENVKVHREVLSGNPAEEILRYAGQSKISLIAMASHGSSSQGPWVLGNIAAKVLRASGFPVLLVSKPANENAIKQQRIIKRILLPLDGSETGKAAIPYTEALALAMGAEEILFQVLEPIEGFTGITAAPPNLLTEMRAKRRSFAEEYLRDIGKPFKEKGIRVSEVIAFGSPAQEILEYARKEFVDLIAVSTHGRSGIGRWVFGSVTDKLLHNGDTPILVVQAKKGSAI